MTGQKNQFLENGVVGPLPLEMIIEQNLRDDGIVKPLDKWPIEHIKLLHNLVKKELSARKETRPVWV